MNIIGQQKSSFIDYPDKICTVYFVGGCNFRCPYCHNRDIVNNVGEPLQKSDILKFLRERKRFIDAVCISGGEPTLQKGLAQFVLELKNEGFYVKLDTNGYRPDVLKELIKNELLDYIAMDVKGPLEKYNELSGINIDTNLILESINLIKESNIDYEFRTTVCKELIKKDDIISISNLLKGSKRYFIQNFRDGETVLCVKGNLTPYKLEELEEVVNIIKDNFTNVKVR